MKKALILFLLASNAYGYNPATREQQVEQTTLLEDIKTNTAGGGGGSNASVGSNGAAIPTSSTQIGFDNLGSLVPVSATNPLPISGSISATNPSVSATGAAIPAQATMIGGTDGTNLRALSVSSGGVLALPTGAATSALQTTGNTSLSSIDGKTPALVTGRVPVDGSGVTQPVSAASLPLPTGASTSALQTTGNSSLSSIDSKLVPQNTDFGSSTTAIRVAAILGNTTGEVSYDTGVSDIQTQRVTIATSDIVQTKAAAMNAVDTFYFSWVDEGPIAPATPFILGTASGDAHHIHIFDSSGSILEFLVNATRKFLIPPGGFDTDIPIEITNGDEISVATIDGTTLEAGAIVVTTME